MSDLKVEQKQTLSREEAARLITALAEGLSAGGKVTVQMGNSTLELSVAGQVDCELEVAVDGDEIELEAGAEVVDLGTRVSQLGGGGVRSRRGRSRRGRRGRGRRGRGRGGQVRRGRG